MHDPVDGHATPSGTSPCTVPASLWTEVLLLWCGWGGGFVCFCGTVGLSEGLRYAVPTPRLSLGCCRVAHRWQPKRAVRIRACTRIFRHCVYVVYAHMRLYIYNLSRPRLLSAQSANYDKPPDPRAQVNVGAPLCFGKEALGPLSK